MLRDDVLIENNKYGCVIIQNNGAMKKLTSSMCKQLKSGILSSAAPVNEAKCKYSDSQSYWKWTLKTLNPLLV